MDGFKNAAIACFIIAFLGVVGFSVYLVRAFLPVVGMIYLVVLSLAAICALALVIEFTVRRFTRVSTHDIGQFGTLTHNLLGSHRVHSPYSERQIAEPKVKVSLVVPTVAELLKEGSLGTADLLLGYRLDGSPKWGSWSNINTFCIAGKSRSGKTITLFFLILQAILNGAIVWVCDPHGAGRKQSALKKLLEPLKQWVSFACTPDDIANMADRFLDIMQSRIDGTTDDFTPFLFVCDEFNGIAEEITRLYELVNKCAREYAGVYGYAAIAGHEWTATGKGKGLLVAMRRNLHAKFVHRLDEGYAKFLLNSGKHAKQTEKLRTGCNFFQDVEGEVDELKTPLGTVQDAVTVSELLTKMLGPVYEPEQIVSQDSYDMPLLRRLEEPEPNRFNPEPQGFKQGEPQGFKSSEQVLSIAAPSEPMEFNTYQGRKEAVRKLKAAGFNQADIIYRIWGARKGATQAYEDALKEYRHIIAALLEEVSA